MEDRLGALKFVAARYRRLWPTIFLGTLLGVMLLPPVTLGQFILGALMIPLLSPGMFAFPLNSPSWSASLEIVLNAFHALVFRHVSNGPLLVAVLFSAAITLFALPSGHGVDRGPWGGELVWGIFRGLISYPLGIILWRTWKDKPPLLLPAWLTFAILPVFVIASSPWAAGYPWADLVFIIIVCPLLIAGGLNTAPRWGAFMGAISFPLYAIHDPIMEWAGTDVVSRSIAAMLATALCCGYQLLSQRRSKRTSVV